MDTTPPVEPIPLDTVKKDTTKTVTTTANTVAVPDTNKVVKPVHIDGVLYVIIGVTGSLIAAFASETASKLIEPMKLFIMRTIVEAIAAGALYLKAFRDKGYTDSIKDKTV